MRMFIRRDDEFWLSVRRSLKWNGKNTLNFFLLELGFAPNARIDSIYTNRLKLTPKIVKNAIPVMSMNVPLAGRE